ncbi:hypothetical protein PIB30_078145 [Stylosanthes scabra]|uniref:Uncharacterized protein n=1 Tax=Stylosanthes scabra TaxID=79078 RepID=A0ABU6ZPB7_9FABA|nr:hypothetical protein [Stylosanthes scabra]
MFLSKEMHYLPLIPRLQRHFSDSKGASRIRFMSLGGREPPRGSRSCFMRFKRMGRRMVGSQKTYLRCLLSFGDRRTSRSCNRQTKRIRPPRTMDLYTQADPPPTPPLERGCEVFERTHTRKKDRQWVDKQSLDVKEAYDAEKKKLEAEWQRIINAGGPKPPSVDEEEIWTCISGGREKGKICDKGVVLMYSYHRLIGDADNDDTATGPPDVREQVTLLNREIPQQAEVHLRGWPRWTPCVTRRYGDLRLLSSPSHTRSPS